MEKKSINKIKKIIGLVLISTLFLVITIGSVFGFEKATKNNGGIDTSYNDYVKIQTNVESFNNGKDINDAAEAISSTLEFLGLQNAVVKIVGDDGIIITNPISSYSYEEFNWNNNLDDHFDLIDTSSNSSYLKEVGSLIISLLFNGTLDFRDTEGEALIIDSESIEGYEINSSFGVEIEETETETSSTYSGDSVILDPVNFYDDAYITHSNGYPIINLQISKKGKNGDDFINLFKDLDNMLKSSDSTMDYTYVVWFDYERTYQLIETLDPEGLSSSESLYSYVSANPNLRPLYVTSSSETLLSSKYSDVLEFSGNFTEQQSKYFVNKINNSNSFKFSSDINVVVVTNLSTKIMLAVLAIILIVIILIVIFSFVSYFGLLGLISSSVFLLTSMIITLLYASTGILITGMGLVSLGIIICSAALISLIITNMYLKNNEDKYLSVNSVAIIKLKSIQSALFLPLVSTILLFYISGLVLTTLVVIPLYLVVIGLVISYIFGMVVLLPIIYIFDLLTKFTRDEQNKKWDLLVGFTSNNTSEVEEVIDGGKSLKVKSIIGVIITLIVLGLTAGIGGTLYAKTGSAINSNSFGNESYAYLVDSTSLSSDMYLSSEVPEEIGISGWDSTMSEYFYNATNSKIKDVESAFENNNIRVSNIQVIRNDEFNINNSTLMGSYGFEIYSKDELTTEKANLINDELDLIEVNLTEEINRNTTTDFEIIEGMSWNGTYSSKIISYTNSSSLIDGFYALLIMIALTTFIMLFVGNIGISIATLISTLFESILLISPLIIFYIPFSSILLFPILLLAGLSFRTKIIIARQAKQSEVTTGRWERAAKKHQFAMPIFSSLLLFFELFLFGTLATSIVISLLIVTILAPLSIYLIQQFIFPLLAKSLGDRREGKVKLKLKSDIERTKNKNKDEIMEEYIEGINM